MVYVLKINENHRIERPTCNVRDMVNGTCESPWTLMPTDLRPDSPIESTDSKVTKLNANRYVQVSYKSDLQTDPSFQDC